MMILFGELYSYRMKLQLFRTFMDISCIQIQRRNFFSLVSVSVTMCMSFLQTVHHNAYHEDPYAQEFGIKISEKLASVEARVLPAPWVINTTNLM